MINQPAQISLRETIVFSHYLFNFLHLITAEA